MAMSRMVLHKGNASQESCVSKRVLCVVCCALVAGLGLSPCLVGLVHGRPVHPGDSLPFCLLVQLEFPQHHGASGPRAGLNEAFPGLGMDEPNLLQFRQGLLDELRPDIVWPCQPHMSRPQGRRCNRRRPLFQAGGVPQLALYL